MLAGDKSVAKRVLRSVTLALAGTAVDKAVSTASSAKEAVAALGRNGSAPNPLLATLVASAFQPSSDFMVRGRHAAGPDLPYDCAIQATLELEACDDRHRI